MKINPLKVKIRDLVAGFEDREDEGAVGYGGRLDIRPRYQREFIYSEARQIAVIDSIMHGYPINAMYWAPKDGGGWELLDGQQRTMSICKFAAGDLPYNRQFLSRMPQDQIDRFLDYDLLIFECTGTASERLAWFQTINTGGLQLKDQEIRNAVYAGPWVDDAKRYFSKSNAPGRRVGAPYVAGDASRQDYLETAIKWQSGASTDDEIREFMNEHAADATAGPLWQYFQRVVNWIESVFTKSRAQMKGLPWGDYFRKWENAPLTKQAPAEIERMIQRLLIDDDVTNKRGIYAYLLSGEEKHLSIRAFSEAMRLAAYTRQDGVCPICGKRFELEDMEADHITPWTLGGPTSADNCQMLCKECNRRKGAK